MTRHQRLLEQIFENPIRSDIKWSEVVSLIIHLGGEIEQRSGSRVKLILNRREHVFHAPHPQKEMIKGAIRQLRDFLLNAGVKP
ncbi:MAG: type II toxin-antitoxin system HicA family toxin [Candidatus Omnitrophota bacterium]|jgi:hypothetical protein|nr:MAG: type II toxin-antitoxin system HicA family toxin [Candidatus Omnitrophota bacterium]